ncbi:hypothetical protein A3D00_03320 [Candidatus Woesebacteria bacterium RIFCSPHIGHO2_02_FULL_38_9]|uniref:Single-stranded DNA-binding protein n=1 Tax=Candidatus Woesebacteria bacterium RIFCSPHIGHO2_01_FULL_39_28 TaxID=1802496 RepID=A0A1F7YEI6_9BACT|nr:MAG: hypothetical protein A2627_01525 [Candidatus Woesebacteria bacterium RIFCSPHIGHO2_01_FULL_39_28]OGM32265.1 MAG: hypothetical protein A3D00_03320 [Candidatus Woesebacteria bacterium RIFCSPHIGHO2_02_FULL_38_9]OGM56866.1 MAG: hypothetical protein A3A50_03910 [Candidatus Woesebacteria bacterium RIFCSPLOWO2_01_FULL_38_20]
MARSLNKVLLIGNLTRDPEMRYTPAGAAVCTFGLATNRQWKTETGETKEEAEFFRLVAWNKLAEICSQMLHKGNRVFAEGRLQTRNWTGNDGQQRTTVEVVISDMIVLTPRGVTEEINVPEDLGEAALIGASNEPEVSESKKKSPKTKTPEKKDENPDDLPF